MSPQGTDQEMMYTSSIVVCSLQQASIQKINYLCRARDTRPPSAVEEMAEWATRAKMSKFKYEFFKGTSLFYGLQPLEGI